MSTSVRVCLCTNLHTAYKGWGVLYIGLSISRVEGSRTQQGLRKDLRPVTFAGCPRPASLYGTFLLPKTGRLGVAGFGDGGCGRRLWHVIAGVLTQRSPNLGHIYVIFPGLILVGLRPTYKTGGSRASGVFPLYTDEQRTSGGVRYQRPPDLFAQIMAQGEVTGSTVQELAELEFYYKKSPKFQKEGVEFEEAYCTTRIGKQPEDYDGPTRYCSNRVSRGDDGEHHPSCRFHGGSNGEYTGGLYKHAGLKHSMYALPETIRETLSEEENEVLDDVLKWPEVYGIDLDEDPAAGHSFDTMAIEIVRQFRTSLYILSEYEVTTKGVYSASGQRLLDESGSPVSEDAPNSLISAHQTQIRLIEKMKESLGVSRKARNAAEQTDDRTDAIEGVSEALGGLIKSGEGSYDPSQFDET